MAGPNLEVFKFGLYLFFPIAVMVQFGDPEWYRKHVVPYRNRIFPREEDTYKPPVGRHAMLVELENMKARKIARRHERDNQRINRPEKDEERLV